METQIINRGTDGLTKHIHNDWSMSDVLKMVSNERTNGEITLNGCNGVLLSYCSGRVSVMDAKSDFTVHFDDDEIDLVRVTTYDDKISGNIEFFTSRAEFHITVWFDN